MCDGRSRVSAFERLPAPHTTRAPTYATGTSRRVRGVSRTHAAPCRTHGASIRNCPDPRPESRHCPDPGGRESVTFPRRPRDGPAWRPIRLGEDGGPGRRSSATVLVADDPGPRSAGTAAAGASPTAGGASPPRPPGLAAPHPDNPVHVQDAVAVAVDLAFRPRSGRAGRPRPHRPGHRPPNQRGAARGARHRGTPAGRHRHRRHLDRLTAVHTPIGREIVPVLGDMGSAAARAPNAVRLLWELRLEGQRLREPWNWGPFARSPTRPSSPGCASGAPSWPGGPAGGRDSGPEPGRCGRGTNGEVRRPGAGRGAGS